MSNHKRPTVIISGEMRFVRATDDKIETYQKRHQPPDPRRVNSRVWGVSGSLSEGDLERLRRVEDALFSWLAADEENAVEFARDPVAALEKADLHLPRGLLKQLRRIRSTARRVEPQARHVRLGVLRTSVEGRKP